MQARPTFRREAALWRAGFRLIAGVDEVGRGPLAGPVMAAAVILPARSRFPWLADVRDSKLLTAAQRERLAGYIWERALAVGLGLQTPERIDEVGIAVAGRLAMAQALAALNPAAEYALIDAFTLPAVDLPHEGIIHGDALCLSIAAASIIAKVERDRMMLAYDDVYPVLRLSPPQGLSHPRTPAGPLQRRPLSHPPPLIRPRARLLGMRAGGGGAMSDERRRLGQFGERVAAAHLEAEGYRIVERNFRCREGEIDIIAPKQRASSLSRCGPAAATRWVEPPIRSPL